MGWILWEDWDYSKDKWIDLWIVDNKRDNNNFEYIEEVFDRKIINEMIKNIIRKEISS
jgi:hypothetical protein